MSKAFNLSIIENEVNTQYTDMKGISAIDGHEYSYLIDMCKEHGIDMDKYYLLGLEFSGADLIGERNEEYSDETYVYAILLSNEDYPACSFEELAALLNQLPCVHAKKIGFPIKYSDISKYIKRFQCLVVSDMSSNIQSLEIEDIQE